MKITHITLLGKEYPLCFSASAQEKIRDYFGDDRINEKDIKISDVDELLIILMDAGRLYCKLAEIESPPQLECKPSDILDTDEMAEMIRVVFDTITKGNEREVEAVQPKNAAATQGE